MRFRRFCPSCGVDRPAVNYQCVICGSPVRLASRQRTANDSRATTAVSWNGNISSLSVAQARSRSEAPAAA